MCGHTPDHERKRLVNCDSDCESCQYLLCIGTDLLVTYSKQTLGIFLRPVCK